MLSDLFSYRVLGDVKVKAEFTEAHCRQLAEWFNADGEFVQYGTPPSSRERLWNCMSLLAHGDVNYRALAEQIILKTPIDHNHFEPIAAAEVHVRFRDILSPEALAHLQRIVEEHLVNMIEVRFGGPGTNNFTCMSTWFLLAASQVLERYPFTHPLASIPEVYVSDRIKTMGLNGLHALAHHAEHEPVFREFNSPTYSPISVHAMAKIVEMIDDPRAKELALSIEDKLWRELLSFYHPELGVSCGPYSRSYRGDILGQNTQMRMLLCYCGISKDASLVELLEDPHPGVLVHHDGDVPFTWSGPAWQLNNQYHVPIDALEELANRTYPHEFSAGIWWDEFGYIDMANRRYISVQGDLISGGTATIHQRQGPRWSLGYRSESTYAHSFPIHFHYALTSPVKTMKDVRNVTAAVAFFGAPDEWVPDQLGKPMEAANFNNAAKVCVEEQDGSLHFTAQAFPQFSPLPANELSLNSFVPIHFAEVAEITLNGQRYTGEPIEVHGQEAVCRVAEAGFEYEFTYRFPAPVTFRLFRWANFLRFAGFWYEGEAKEHTAEFLQGCTAEGLLKIMRTP
ncbi:MAG: hypothetical protein ACYC7E_00050 [Armatimonadota bacterium]